MMLDVAQALRELATRILLNLRALHCPDTASLEGDRPITPTQQSNDRARRFRCGRPANLKCLKTARILILSLLGFNVLLGNYIYSEHCIADTRTANKKNNNKLRTVEKPT